MEHKLGEIVTLPNGRKAEVVEVDKDRLACKGCVFRTNTGRTCWNVKVMQIIGECNKVLRTDHKNIVYKEIKEEK